MRSEDVIIELNKWLSGSIECMNAYLRRKSSSINTFEELALKSKINAFEIVSDRLIEIYT